MALEDLSNNFTYEQEGLAGYYGAPDKIVVSSELTKQGMIKGNPFPTTHRIEGI